MALLAVLFVLGYIAIAMEHPIRINKSATALLLGNVLWMLWFIISGDHPKALEQLSETLESVTPILFFLMGAMTIVAVVDAHDGFSMITARIQTTSLRKLLWLIAWITFFMSSVLDNMTTAIVMVTLTHKLLAKAKDRLFFAGIIVIAANAGGAFSPIGDVTTTMLWIGGQVSATGILKATFLASVVNLLLPLLFVTRMLNGPVHAPHKSEHSLHPATPRIMRDVMFVLGIGGLVMVPILKTLVGVPPYIGMMLSLGVLWFFSELLLRNQDEVHRDHLSLTKIMAGIDLSSILFFAGILFAVGTLEATGQLESLAVWLGHQFGDVRVITILIGLFSSVVDNVPLVAASMGMYNLQTYPMDHLLWEFIAYSAGTGGSILIIGSAAGVATMGIEKITFGWYLRRIAPLALLGFAGGAAVYLLQRSLLG